MLRMCEIRSQMCDSKNGKFSCNPSEGRSINSSPRSRRSPSVKGVTPMCPEESYADPMPFPLLPYATKYLRRVWAKWCACFHDHKHDGLVEIASMKYVITLETTRCAAIYGPPARIEYLGVLGRWKQMNSTRSTWHRQQIRRTETLTISASKENCRQEVVHLRHKLVVVHL